MKEFDATSAHSVFESKELQPGLNLWDAFRLFESSLDLPVQH